VPGGERAGDAVSGARARGGGGGGGWRRRRPAGRLTLAQRLVPRQAVRADAGAPARAPAGGYTLVVPLAISRVVACCLCLWTVPSEGALRHAQHALQPSCNQRA